MGSARIAYAHVIGDQGSLRRATSSAAGPPVRYGLSARAPGMT